MAAEPLTLEELIDRATDINNLGSNEEAAQSVVNQVNREIGGTSTAVKCIIQRLQLHQEVITLQALTVVEYCVKYCGVKFHNEIGKYKFINELIKLLSPKYDGDITPPAVKERVISLLFNWYCGLPQEKKIAEAYRMLKQQGIIKHDPVDANRPTPPPYKEESSVIEDEDSSALLATLLASTDPEDLHSANKLIKSMVKQEEQRLDRVSKRVQDLETVSNSVKLLDDMLQKFVANSTGHEDLEIMHDLYESCLKLRPELFRLASRSAEDKDDSMAEILCASDELTRVIDTYKEKILLQKITPSTAKPYNVEDSSANTSLLDLGFDGQNTGSNNDTVNGTSQLSGNSLLDEQFKLLGLDVPAPATQPPMHNVGLVNQLSQSTWQSQQAMQTSMNYARPPMMGVTSQSMFQIPPPMQTSQQLIGAMRPTVPISSTPQPFSAPNRGTPAPSEPTPKKKNDLLDFDVFSEFHSPTLMISQQTKQQPTTDKVDGANQSALNNMLDISNEPTFNSNDSYLEPSVFGQTNMVTPIAPQITVPDKVKSTVPLSSNSMNLIDTFTPAPHVGQTTIGTPKPPASTFESPKPPPQQPPTPVTPEVPSAAARVASPQENYAVPLEALKPADYPPSLIHEKNGLKTLLHIAQDTRATANTNVIAAILSTISTSTSAVTDFSIQVAVPKVMRVKLQPATSTELKAYNPIFPPPSISQVILIANPTKENVRLRFKITYNLNGVPYSEASSIDQLPVT